MGGKRNTRRRGPPKAAQLLSVLIKRDPARRRVGQTNTPMHKGGFRKHISGLSVWAKSLFESNEDKKLCKFALATTRLLTGGQHES